MTTNSLHAVPTVADIQVQMLALREAKANLTKIKTKLDDLIKPFADAAEVAEAQLTAMMKAAKIDNMEVSVDATSNLKAEFVPKQAPKVESWDELYAWIKENGRFDMLHKRVSSAPVVELFQIAQDGYDDEMEQLYPDVLAFAKAKYLPPGVTVTEWKELKLSETAPKKPRKAAR